VVGPLRVGQVLIVALAGVFALAALYAFRSFAGLVIGIVVVGAACALVLAPVEGRTAEEWAPILIRWLLEGRRSGHGFRATTPTAGVNVGGDGAGEPELCLPPQLGDLTMLEVPYSRSTVGVIRDRRAGTYTTALAVRAGAFGLRDWGEQEQKLQAWGTVLASCGRDGSPVRRLQWIETTLPGQADELASHFQAERDRTVPLDLNVVSSYIELVEAAAPVTQEHEILVVIQVDQRRGGREMRRLGGGDDGACEVLLREAEALAANLAEAGVRVFGLLRPDHYAEAVRNAFDPFGRLGRSRVALSRGQGDGVPPGLMGPTATEAAWGHFRADSAVNSTYWISSWPRSDVGPLFMAPLLMQSTSLRRVSVTIEPIPYSVALRRAEAAQTAEVADELARQKQGFITTARTRRRQEAASRREEELADGHAELRIAGFVTAYERSVAALERSAPSVEHAAALARLELRRLWGEQDSGFTYTLPLGWGLAR
jgi:hypothetical protein